PHVRARRDQPGLRAHRARQGRRREPHHVGARAAQRVDPDHHQRDGAASRLAGGRLSHRALLLDPRHRPRGDPRRRALRLPGDQGDHRVRRGGDHGVQPARRPDVQGRRPARPAQVGGDEMAIDLATLPAAAPAREIPHTVSPSLWTLAWRRLRQDRVAMVSMAIVAAFLVLITLSATGLIAADWSREVGVNYAPPTFMGPDASSQHAQTEATAPAAESETLASHYHSTIVDPLADVLAEIRAKQGKAPGAAAGGAAASPDATVDPLADVMADIRAGKGGAVVSEARAATLPFGGDKWGRDVLKKTIKGSETSILVGILSAVLATFLGTLFGALAGYYGKGVDDFFNWFYSVFSSIPYLLLILAVAAVLKQKGLVTIVLILGLTGWSGIFRLVRGEYLKHKAREYVQAADAIGASNLRRMFVHIFPNISHVVLVQL